ncbi:diguanylate cyclase [Paenibacillus sp. GCM10023252]|uniref:diguanylate cyclase n=1 Tax=Paenibacillus sp. GCM10023252 TaxID=3252649 RepID=UPI003606887D
MTPFRPSSPSSPLRMKFHTLLSGLLALSLIGSSAILMGIALHKQNQTLTEATLLANFEGARNLNIAMNTFKDLMFRELGSTARFLSEEQPNRDVQASKWLGALLGGRRLFNGALMVDKNGTVLAATPESGYTVGVRFQPSTAAQALREPRPQFSDAYVGPNGHRTVLVTHPLGERGQPPNGFIGGLIDLEAENIYSNLFREAIRSSKGTFAYIVDRSDSLLLSPDPSRLGEVIPSHSLQGAFSSGRTRHASVADADGRIYLTGYLAMPDLGWGVVFQSPAAHVEAAMTALLKTQLTWILPLFALLLVLSLWMARRLAAPFAALTAMARGSAKGERITAPPFERHWNYEAHHLSKAVMKAVHGLQSQTDLMTEQALTDPLTGLPNRARLDRWLNEERHDKARAYALLVIDIDYFKKVNDLHGHQMGDEALKHLSRVLLREAEETDLICRFGGEEFVVLLPRKSLPAALEWAERVRKQIEAAPSPTGKPITVSIGLACCADDGSSFSEVFEQADQALYEAKRSGRNRTVAFGSSSLAG